MKHRLLFVLTLLHFISFPPESKAQLIKEDSAFYESGKIYWRSYRNANISGNKGRTVEYFYENGQHKLTQVTDSSYAQEKLLEFWLPDGTQLVKGGAGKYIEAGRDSCIYTIANGKYNGPAEKYKYHSRYQTGIHFWKLYGAGNYENGFKNGAWDFVDTSGYKTATVNYVNDTVRGKCILYFTGSNKIKSEGNLLNCLQEGEWKSYDENGNLSSRANFKNGVKVGEYTEYYVNGKIKLKGQYIQSVKTLRTAVENPYSPGTFRLEKRKFTVACKAGIWLYYNENGNLMEKKKHRNKFDPPANYEQGVYRHKKYYDPDLRIVSGIPDCNYY